MLGYRNHYRIRHATDKQKKIVINTISTFDNIEAFVQRQDKKQGDARG